MTEQEIREKYPWATTGKTKDRERNVITSLELDSSKMEKFNRKLIDKYREIEEKEVRYEEIQVEDAEYLLIAYGTTSRICEKVVQLAREEGIKLGLLRPITLFPFPRKRLDELSGQVKGMLSVEMSAGQMVEDVRLAVNGKVQVEYYGRMGGIIPSAKEIVDALKQKFIGG
jgi:2-oxoglutarate ferredoxin oxidoreductase subunit alpha